MCIYIYIYICICCLFAVGMNVCAQHDCVQQARAGPGIPTAPPLASPPQATRD